MAIKILMNSWQVEKDEGQKKNNPDKPRRGTEKTYFDDCFNDWLEETYKFRITYKDGLVFMLEKNIEETQ